MTSKAVSPEYSTRPIDAFDLAASYDTDDSFDDNDAATVEHGVAVSETNESMRAPFDLEDEAKEVTFFTVCKLSFKQKRLYFLLALCVSHFRNLPFVKDERGNLRAVNFVIRRPCTIFNLLITLCLIFSFLLNRLVFRQAENGNPFTPPSNEFDLNDVRSIQYDSLRLAKDDVAAGRKIVDMEGDVVAKQSETSAM